MAGTRCFSSVARLSDVPTLSQPNWWPSRRDALADDLAWPQRARGALTPSRGECPGQRQEYGRAHDRLENSTEPVIGPATTLDHGGLTLAESVENDGYVIRRPVLLTSLDTCGVAGRAASSEDTEADKHKNCGHTKARTPHLP